MYLDPGVTGMAIQGIFALLAALLTVFRVPRHLMQAARALISKVRR